MHRKNQILHSHKNDKYFSLINNDYVLLVNRFFEKSIEDDLGIHGDITSKAIVPEKASGRGIVLSREKGIVAGLEEVKYFFGKYRVKDLGAFVVKALARDGDLVGSDQPVLQIFGKGRALLAIERTVLNYIQRMSGIATYTAGLVKMVPKNVLVCPTRKTLWGILDKKGAVVGGGGTHRLNLEDAVLIKSNHLVFSHGFDEVFEKVMKSKMGRFFEIEVRSPIEALTVAGLLSKIVNSANMKYATPVIMFDNFSARKIRATIDELKKKGFYKNILFEASGGINEKNIKLYAKSGVDTVSLGSITHSSRAMDFSMKIEAIPSRVRS